MKGIPVKKNKTEVINDDTKQTSTGEIDMITLPKKKKAKNDQVVGKKKEVVGDKLSRTLNEIQSLKSKIILLEKEIGTLNSKNQRLESSYNEQVEELEKYMTMVKDLSKKAEMTENLQRENNALRNDLAEFEERANSAEAALNEKEMLLESIKNSTESKHFELEFLLKEKEENIQKIQMKDQLISDKENEIESLKENIEKLKQQNQELSSQVILSETENDSIAKKLADKTKEIDQIRNELEELKEKFEKANEDIQNKQKEIISLKQKNEEETMNYQSTLATQINEKSQLKSTLKEKDIIINDSKRQISLMEKNINELQNNLNEVTKEKESITQKYNEDYQKLQDALATIKTHERKIDSLNQTIQDKENEKKSLQVHYDQMQSIIQNQNDENKTSLLSTIEKQQNKISKQCEEIESLKIRLSDADSQNLNLQDKIKLINQDSNFNKDRYDDYRSKYEKLQSEIHKLDSKLLEEQNENQDLNSKVIELEKEIDISNSQIALLTNENQKLLMKINSLTEEADQINGDNDKLKAQTKENLQLHSRCQELEKLNELLHDRIDKATQENAESKAKLNEREREIADMRSKKAINDNNQKILYVQRIFELEEEVKTYRQSPAFYVTEGKMKIYDDQIKKLKNKMQSLQAELDKKEMKHVSHHPSGEKIIIQSQKAKIQELERIIDNLKFENKVLSNSQAGQNKWKEEFEEKVKRDIESREELKKSLLQVRYRHAAEIENQQNQM